MSDTATILVVSPRQRTIWTMPRATYDLVVRVLETWRYVHGRRPRGTVERALALLERTYPDVRAGVTCEQQPEPEPAIRGHSASICIDYNLPLEELPAPRIRRS